MGRLAWAMLACNPWAMAWATGCSDWLAMAYAVRAHSAASAVALAWAALSAQPRTCQSCKLGRPVVRVPVLSRAMWRRRWAVSSTLPPLSSRPLRAAAVRLLTMVIGVDSTRAQGQAMTSKASAW